MDLTPDLAAFEPQARPEDMTTPSAEPAEPVAHQPRWRRFDAAWYVARHAETLAAEGVAGSDELEAFYWQKGCRLGHSPNMFFDEAWYLSTYPDVATHVATGGARSGFEHYIRDGHRDR